MKLFNLKHAALMAAVALVAPCLQSCGDDEPGDPNKNKPTETTSEFVGAWEGEMGDFVFFSDGYAKLLPASRYSGGFGKWTYNKDTNILATTISNWQFVVTLTSNDEWAAIAASGTGTYSFEEIDDEDYAYCVLRGATWTDETGESGKCNMDLTSEGVGNGIVNSVSALGGILNGYLALYEDDDNNDNTFRYTLYSREYHYSSHGSYYYFQTQHRGTAKFSNMTSATKCELEITSNHSNPEDRIHHVLQINNTNSTEK